MATPEVRTSLIRGLLALASAATLAVAACAPQPAAPTAAPAKPAPTAAPAKPAPTTAPAKPAATTAPAKPAATAAPAAKPTEKPAAKPAFDEKAVADFYKGKTVRIVVGFGPGGTTDTNARLLQQVLSRYIPGNPTLVVENKPGGGSMLAANTVYASEPKDGTVIAAIGSDLITQQAIGAKGVQFDANKFQWLGSTYESANLCAARMDSGISKIQDVLEGGKELTVSSYGKGSNSYDPPAIMNAALGTRFKIITGYESGAAQRLAVQNKEVQGFCAGFQPGTKTGGSGLAGMFDSPNPLTRALIVSGPVTPKHPILEGVPAAETLAKTDEARTLLKIMHATAQVQMPMAVAPEVPADRVQALRKAYDQAYKDAEFLAGAEKANLAVSPKTGEQVGRLFQEMVGAPPAILAKVKQVLE